MVDNIIEQKVFINNKETLWSNLPIIFSLTSLSALFHDVGKANKWFQNKLKKNNVNKIVSDPFRHEYLSCLILINLVKVVEAENDLMWLETLAHKSIDWKLLQSKLQDTSKIILNSKNFNLFEGLDANNFPILVAVCYLIISHHFQPGAKNLSDADLNCLNKYPIAEWNNYLCLFRFNLGYVNKTGYKEKEIVENLTFNLTAFEKSKAWLSSVAKSSSALLLQIKELTAVLLDPQINCAEILYQARIALILGDHYFSSLDKSNLNAQLALNQKTLFANSINGRLNQNLIEHLIGVKEKALLVVDCLPTIANKLDTLNNVNELNIKSPTIFQWQDLISQAVENIKDKNTLNQSGKFIINMASTGCGKTFGNVKALYAVSENKTLRCSIALGLRTLTLQTGNEFRTKLKLSNKELAVVIGSKAVRDLNNEEPLFEDIVDYDSIPCAVDNVLETVISDSNALRFLGAPVLVCTIDQIIKATENTKGAKGVLAAFRLLSADIIIDEVDDYIKDDLKALGRFIFLAGLFGRNVLISSATINKEIAEGLYICYQNGWNKYAKNHNKIQQCLCFWIDEFNILNSFINYDKNEVTIRRNFEKNHYLFVQKRIAKLLKQPILRKGEIVKLEDNSLLNQLSAFTAINEEIISLHNRFFETDKLSGKKVSFGLVRFSNIAPCVAFSRFLEESNTSENFNIYFTTYHARQVLLLRHEQEKYLDKILNRKDKNAIFNDPTIRDKINAANSENIVFVVVSSPVEELGRDHDFDWAIIEPASLRSIIQTSGRVMRHRKYPVNQPNVGILEYNFNYIKRQKADQVFQKPGFEIDYQLPTHNLNKLVDETFLNNINALNRIDCCNYKSINTFADIEHAESLKWLYANANFTSATDIAGYYSQYFFFTALSQKTFSFRSVACPESTLQVFIDDDKYVFKEEIDGEYRKVNELDCISVENKYEGKKEWIKRNLEELMYKYSKELGISLQEVCSQYCSINIPNNNNCDTKWCYSDTFGLYKKEN